MVITQKQYNKFWLASIILLLVIQYIRPQELIPGLNGVPLFMPISGIVVMFLLFSKNITTIFSSTQSQLVLLFVGWFTLFIPFSQLPGASAQAIRNFLPLLPFVFSVPLLVNTKNTLHKLTDVFIILAVFIAVVGYLTHAGGRYQMFLFGNFLTDPNDYALYMNTMFPICFFMMLYERKRAKQIFYGIATVLAVMSVITSHSRGGFLGLLGVTGIIWLFSPNKKVISIIGVIGIVSVMLFSPSTWLNTVSTSFDTQQSTAQTRLETWKLSIDAFVDHPMGIGIANTPSVIHRYSKSERWWGDVNHSFWFTSLLEGGIIGFIIVLTLLATNIRHCSQLGRLKEINDETRFLKYFGRAYLGAIIGFLICGTFLTVNYYPHIWYMTAMIAAGVQVRNVVAQTISTQYVLNLESKINKHEYYRYQRGSV